MSAFRVSRIVEFSETDMAGIVHFSNFFRYFEAAEHAYLRACGLSVVTTWEGEEITFPRVSAACDYLRPARFEDELSIEVGVERMGRTSIRYAFTARRAEDEVATGHITAVLCRFLADRRLEPFAFPEELRRRIALGPLGG